MQLPSVQIRTAHDENGDLRRQARILDNLSTERRAADAERAKAEKALSSVYEPAAKRFAALAEAGFDMKLELERVGDAIRVAKQNIADTAEVLDRLSKLEADALAAAKNVPMGRLDRLAARILGKSVEALEVDERGVSLSLKASEIRPFEAIPGETARAILTLFDGRELAI